MPHSFNSQPIPLSSRETFVASPYSVRPNGPHYLRSLSGHIPNYSWCTSPCIIIVFWRPFPHESPSLNITYLSARSFPTRVEDNLQCLHKSFSTPNITGVVFSPSPTTSYSPYHLFILILSRPSRVEEPDLRDPLTKRTRYPAQLAP
jgi:hypothetical protein